MEYKAIKEFKGHAAKLIGKAMFAYGQTTVLLKLDLTSRSQSILVRRNLFQNILKDIDTLLTVTFAQINNMIELEENKKKMRKEVWDFMESLQHEFIVRKLKTSLRLLELRMSWRKPNVIKFAELESTPEATAAKIWEKTLNSMFDQKPEVDPPAKKVKKQKKEPVKEQATEPSVEAPKAPKAPIEEPCVETDPWKRSTAGRWSLSLPKAQSEEFNAIAQWQSINGAPAMEVKCNPPSIESQQANVFNQAVRRQPQQPPSQSMWTYPAQNSVASYYVNGQSSVLAMLDQMIQVPVDVANRRVQDRKPIQPVQCDQVSTQSEECWICKGKHFHQHCPINQRTYTKDSRPNSGPQ